MMKWKKAAAAVLLGGCMLAAYGSGVQAEEAAAPEWENSPEWVSEIPGADEAQQLFVVAGIGQTTAYVSMHEKDEEGTWKQIITTPGYIGKYGLGKTKEGDGKSPVGTFHFNYAFGIAEDPGCAIPYQQVDEDSYWSGDQRDGYSYNQMVSIKDLPDLNVDDSEHILDYTYQYQYCLNISYNEEGTPGLGSAIFLHCLGPQKPYTGGCVAIPKDQMLKVMQNVREDCVVVIDSLETLIPGLWEEWGLAPAEDAESDTDAEAADAGAADAEAADAEAADAEAADAEAADADAEAADAEAADAEAADAEAAEEDAAAEGAEAGTEAAPADSEEAAFTVSELYTAEELEKAAALILAEFEGFSGSECLALDYAGDDCNTEENVKWMNDVTEGKEYTQCAEFLMDFQTPKAEELGESPLEPDQVYTGYQWWLARTEGGELELVTWGY